jgi:hypothetical protein
VASLRTIQALGADAFPTKSAFPTKFWEVLMNYSETLALNDRYQERDADARDWDTGRFRLSDQRPGGTPHPSKPGTPYSSTGHKNAQFRSGRPSISKRLTRSLVRFFFPVFIGVGGTLAWQSYGDAATEMVRTLAPSLGWLLPAATREAHAPAVTSVELQQQLKPVALDLAIVRRSIEQLTTNQDQFARKQEQVTQAITALQAAQQDIGQKISSPPLPKTLRAPPPKPFQPAAQ